jgi:hypothetical protein
MPGWSLVCHHGPKNTKHAAGPATDLGLRATLINQHSPPEILVHGLVTPADVKELFNM